MPARMCCFPPPRGARRTARSRTPSGASRASAASSRLPGEAKPDWWIVSASRAAHGFADAFAYESAADIFREHAALSAFENDGTRDFDLGALEPSQRRVVRRARPGDLAVPRGRSASDTRFFAEGGFFTPDRKARFVAPEAPALRDAASNDYPFVLNTGRVRDQWHTMTRTGLSPRLGQHTPEPFVEVHPDDARALGLKDFARVSTRARRRHLQGRTERRPAARLAVRANPLERRNRFRGERLRAGRAAHRSLFRSARGEGDAGVDRAGRVRLSRLRADARADCASQRHLVGARRARRRHRHADRNRRSAEALARACGER